MPPSSVTRVAVPRFQAAIRQLTQNGVDALKPSLAVNDADPSSYDRRIWRKPAISRRKAAVLRKQAILDNTYGTFDSNTGIGWDVTWDIDLERSKTRGMGRVKVTAPKLTKRFRTREERATKIEAKMEGMDERIEEFRASRLESKPVEKTFEAKYKKMMRGGK